MSAQTQRKTRQKGTNPGKHVHRKTGAKGAQGGIGGGLSSQGRVLGGRAVKFKKPRSTRPVDTGSFESNVEQSLVTQRSDESSAGSPPSSLHNPDKHTDQLLGFSTQPIPTLDNIDDTSKEQAESESEESQNEEDLDDGQSSDDSGISSPAPHEYGIWGTRPLLDKDNMTHQNISEIVQQTFGLDTLTPILSSVQHILATDTKYSSRKWSGTHPKVRHVWL
jgi:hypothetical protein